jgi:hypothetical protein
VTGAELWREFAHDPRSPEFAPMRASDADRDIVLRTLADAYAEGRLDPVEYDERADTVTSAKTLGELPVVLDDLVPMAGVPYGGSSSLDIRTIDELAVAKWEKSRRDAFMGFLIPTLICWVVWGLTMFGGFPWPVFPMIGTAIPLLSTVVQRKDIIESNKRRIVRKQERELRRQQRKQLPPSAPA